MNYTPTRSKMMEVSVCAQKLQLALTEAMQSLDAAEKLYNNSLQANFELAASRDHYSTWLNEERASGHRQNRRIAALQGVITRMKRARKP